MNTEKLTPESIVNYIDNGQFSFYYAGLYSDVWYEAQKQIQQYADQQTAELKDDLKKAINLLEQITHLLAPFSCAEIDKFLQSQNHPNRN